MAARRIARRRLLVIGNGMAGARLVAELRQRAPERFDILVLGEEPVPAYNRILLSAVLSGERRFEDIALAPPGAGDGGIEVLLGRRAVSLDRRRRRVHTADGGQFGYDVAVLATGSRPVMLKVPGAGLAGVEGFRDIGDVERMLAVAGGGRRAVVIGGGLLGLEAAEGLRRRGMAVSVVHLMPWLMERQLDARAGALLRQALERRGIDFLLPAETVAILGSNRAEGVRLGDGRCLQADLVVMAVGIQPHADLAREAGLACGRGITVDDTMRSSDPAVFAVGECVEHRGRCYGLVAPLWSQVEVCAAQLCGDPAARFEGSTDATSLKVTGIDIYSAGDLAADDEEEIVLSDSGRGSYRKLVVREGRLCGAVLFGDTSDGGWYLDLMRRRRDIGAIREALAFGSAAASASPSTH